MPMAMMILSILEMVIKAGAIAQEVAVTLQTAKAEGREPTAEEVARIQLLVDSKRQELIDALQKR